jgi:hypothetical protein
LRKSNNRQRGSRESKKNDSDKHGNVSLAGATRNALFGAQPIDVYGSGKY